MENQIEQFLNFIQDRFKNASFEIIHNSFSQTLKHFIIRDELEHKGFGTDHDLLLSMQKAYSEFIERKTFFRLNDFFESFNTSNGFAAHLTTKKAMEASKLELIERDAFLLIWHSKTSPYWLTEKESQHILNAPNWEIFKMHKVNKLKLSLGILSKSLNVYSCIVKVSGYHKSKEFFYIDTKSGYDIIEIFNSLIESISFFSHYIVTDHLKYVLNKITTPTRPIDHFYYHLNTIAKSQWFHDSNSNVLDVIPFKINSYMISPEDALEIKNLHRVVVFSESEMNQKYYCGKFSLKNININRFEQVFGEKLIFNKTIHPLS